MDVFKVINTIYVNAGNLAVLVLCISILLCLFNTKKLSTPFRRLLYFLIWNLCIEISARVFTYSEVNNLPLLHLYTLGEFILFSWFFKSLLINPKFFQSNYRYFVIGSAILIIFNSLFFQPIYGYNTLAKTSVQLIIICYAVLYFYNLTENQSLSLRQEKSLRLINSAVLIYYSGSLFIFMCSQILIGYSEWIKTFWAFNAILNLIFQLLVLLGIWKVIFKKAPLSS